METGTRIETRILAEIPGVAAALTITGGMEIERETEKTAAMVKEEPVTNLHGIAMRIANQKRRAKIPLGETGGRKSLVEGMKRNGVKVPAGRQNPNG